MNRRSLFVILGVVALVVLLSGGAWFSGALSNFGLGPDSGAGDSGAVAVADGAGADENANDDAPDRAVGTDDDGNTIYVDRDGRRYVLLPDGTKRYLTGKGANGRIANGDNAGTSGTGTDATDPNATGTGKDDPDEEPTEEEPEDENSGSITLTGRVEYMDGTPAAGATVDIWFEESGREDHRETRVDKDGNYRVEKAPRFAMLYVEAHDDNEIEAPAKSYRMTKAEVQTLPKLVLPRGNNITGTVVSKANGSPIKGANVRILRWYKDHNEYGDTEFDDERTTNEAGQFRYENIEGAKYRLIVEATGYASRILNSIKPVWDGTIELEASAFIEGTVKDEEGNPVANAVVECNLHVEPDQDFNTHARTDETGVFRIACQPNSKRNELSILAPGYEFGESKNINSGTTGIEIILKREDDFLVVTGRVVNEDGTVLHADFDWGTDRGKLISDRLVVSTRYNSGYDSFFFHVETIVRWVRVFADDFVVRWIELKGAESGRVDLGDIVMTTSDRTITVTVVDSETGEPIDGVFVESPSGGEDHTDEEGKAFLENMPEGAVSIVCEHPEYPDHSVLTNVSEITIRLKRGTAQLWFRVTDDATDDPIASVSVQLIWDYETVATKTANGAGEVKFTGLKDKRNYDIRIEHDGYSMFEDDYKALESPTWIVVRLTKGAPIRGRVTIAGEPAPSEIELEVLSAISAGDSPWDDTFTTDTEGRFESDAMPYGEYWVSIPSLHVPARKVVVTEDGGEINFDLPARVHVTGTITRDDGSPHANAGIYVYHKAESFHVATVYADPQGQFDCPNLWPGDWVFCILKSQSDASAQYSLPATLTAQAEQSVNLRLPRATGVITGRVTYPDGAPVSGARVAVTNLDANWKRSLLAAYVVTDADGNYRAERLENGARMQVRVGGYNDDAETATAFSDIVTISEQTVSANITVAREGFMIRGHLTRSNGGPFLGGGLGYLIDSQGRLSGLYFAGGGGDSPDTLSFTIRDVPPGTYTMIWTAKGMKASETQITITTKNRYDVAVSMTVLNE